MSHNPDGAVNWAETQALVSSARGDLRFTSYVMVSFCGAGQGSDRGDREAIRSRQAWLRGLLDRITFDRPPDDRSRTGTVLNIAFTAPGLLAMGLTDADLSRLPDDFRGGIASRRATRVLHDVAVNEPDQWQWGQANGDQEREGVPVIDLMLILFASSPEALAQQRESVTAGLPEGSLTVEEHAHAQPLGAFGFRDGLSQPSIDPERYRGTPADQIEPGEILLGYRNEQGKVTDTYGIRADLIPVSDFGLNGSFLVCRQYDQYPDALKSVLNRSASGAERVKAAMIGRWPDGSPLTTAPDSPAGKPNDNDFRFSEDDPSGYRCPFGAHIRRANLRDTLGHHPDQGTEEMKQHRMLRRGRPLTVFDEGQAGPAHGLMFIALMGNIRRQFEFVQEIWLMNPTFMGLKDERDPVLTPYAQKFSMQGPFGGGRVDIDQPLTRLRGGGYFLLPARRDLRILANT